MFNIHIAVILFGLSGLLAQEIPLNPVQLCLGRTAFAALAMLLGNLVIKRRLIAFDTQFGRQYFLQGILLAAHWVFFFYSIKLAGVTFGLLLYVTFPLFTLLLEAPILGKGYSRRAFIPLIPVIPGMILISNQTDMDSTFLAVLCGLLSALSFSLLAILNRKLRVRIDAWTLSFWQILIAFFCLLIFSIFFEVSLSGIASHISGILVLGVVCTAGAYGLFIRGLGKVSAASASFVACLEPVYGIALASIFLKEVPEFKIILGGCLVIIGAALAVLASVRTAKKSTTGQRYATRL
jgi:drug/metabolite transporter (DMT)-like permease